MNVDFSISFADKAKADLAKIDGYYFNVSIPGASRMVGRILDAIEGLRTVPNRAKLRVQPHGNKPPVRSLPAPPYMVFFRVYDLQETVFILRIRHGARKPLKRFD